VVYAVKGVRGVLLEAVNVASEDLPDLLACSFRIECLKPEPGLYRKIRYRQEYIEGEIVYFFEKNGTVLVATVGEDWKESREKVLEFLRG